MPNLNCAVLFACVLAAHCATKTAQAAPEFPPLQAPILTHENNRFVVFDRSLEEHTFIEDDNGRLKPENQTRSLLARLDDQFYIWTDNGGIDHYFNGSFAVSTEPRNANAECIPLPDTPSDPHTEINTDPESQGGSEAESTVEQNPESQTDTDPEAAPSDADAVSSEEQAQCNTQANGDFEFSDNNQAGADFLLDARPASCQSYFVEYYGTRRGSEIETGLFLHAPYLSMTPTLRVFPVVDFIGDNALYVVHSRDLGSSTFNSPNQPDALLEQLLRDGQDIQTRFVDMVTINGSISATELGNSTTITSDQLKPIVMQLVIRDGLASVSHWRQIESARQALQVRYGITLEVVVIP